MKQLLGKLFGYSDKFGVKTVVVEKADVPQPTGTTYQCPEELLKKMRDLDAQKEGCRETIAMVTKDIGEILLQERIVWKEIHETLGIPENISLVLNRETGVIREIHIEE